MRNLTEKQKEIYTYIIDTFVGTSRFPTLTEIARTFSFGRRAAYDAVASIISKGYLAKSPDGSLMLSEEERKNLINRAIPSSDGEGQSYFSLRDTDNGLYFTLQVFSDEMRNIGLMKGDLALFLKTESAKSGDIVLASVSDGDGMMIRRLFIRPDGLFDLVPENDSMGRTTARCVIIHARLVMSIRRYSE